MSLMSGIAGIVRFGGSSQRPELLKHLLDGVARRGTDARDTWSNEQVSMGCCLSRATSESITETQPWVDPASGAVIVWDGRLDNREELIAEVELVRPRQVIPDSRLALAAYLKWHDRSAEKLLGDFAFAIWDPRHQSLYCVRDRMGGGGFTYFRGKNFFAFASVSEALACLPGFAKTPNAKYIASIFVPQFQNRGSRRAWLEEAEVLMPGERMTVKSDGSINLRKYASLEPAAPRHYRSREAAEEHFLQVFTNALNDRMRDPAEFGILMSGGLDSAGLAAAAHRLREHLPGHNLHAYTAISDQPADCIESRSILSMARSLDTRLHQVSVPSMQGMVSLEDLLELAWSKPHPVNSSILIPGLMFLAASRNGHRHVLHGACGDLAMNAPWYYQADLIRRGKIGLALSESRAAGRNNYFLEGKSPAYIFGRSAVQALPATWTGALRRHRASRRPDSIGDSLLNPDLVREINLRERLEQEIAADIALAISGERVRLLQRSLEGICSASSAYNGIAGRHGLQTGDPWSDIRVVDYFHRLPIEFHVHEGWTKYPVRSVFKQELSPEVRWRKDKTHLGWIVTRRLMDESRDLVCQTLNDDLTDIEPFLDVSGVRMLAERYFMYDHHDDRQRVFEAVSLVLWLRRLKRL